MKKHILFALIGLMAATCAQAWNGNDPFDFYLRGKVEIHKKVKDFDFAVAEELISKDMTSQIDKSRTYAIATYKPCSFFKFGIDYRFVAQWCEANATHENKYWEYSHQIRVPLTFTVSQDNFKIEFREQPQFTLQKGKATKYELRHKVQLAYDYKAKKVQPYVAVEFTNTLEKKAYLNKIRPQIGVVWKINSAHALDFSVYNDLKFKREGYYRSELVPQIVYKYTF